MPRVVASRWIAAVLLRVSACVLDSYDTAIEPFRVENISFEELTMTTLKIEDCINDNCPWSGKPVSADSLTVYRGQVVGFCNPGCRDKFEKATGQFESLLKKGDGE